ncbi:MAG: sodium:solute symporter family protein, partial [Deferribacterota bacterium]|nr:sodium:solute symporter family protein [Deferribacterota bacterium]
MGLFFQNNSLVIGTIFVLVMLAAIMSTADSILSAASSHIVKDIIAVYYKKPRNQLMLSKISVLVVGFLALLLSYLLPTIIDALVFSYTIYTSTIFIPLILGIFWQKGDKYAAIISMIISTVVVLLAYFISPPEFSFEIFGALFSFLIYFVITLVKI